MQEVHDRAQSQRGTNDQRTANIEQRMEQLPRGILAGEYFPSDKSPLPPFCKEGNRTFSGLLRNI